MTNINNIVHYVEFFYPYNPDVSDSTEDTYIKQVQEREPSLFISDERNSKIGFRFFDVNNGSSPLIRENRSNVSPIYYYGKYLSNEEITYIHEIMPYTIKSTQMISCYCGYLATELNDGDIAIEDWIKSKTIDNVMLKKKL